MMPFCDSFSPENMKRIEGYHWLKVINLPSNVMEEQLMNHIRKNSKKIPKSIKVHYLKGHSAMAFVEMKSSKEAQIVMNKAQMSTLDGQQIWIQQHPDVSDPRNEHLKGLDQVVRVTNVPLSWMESERESGSKHPLTQICEEY